MRIDINTDLLQRIFREMYEGMPEEDKPYNAEQLETALDTDWFAEELFKFAKSIGAPTTVFNDFSCSLFIFAFVIGVKHERYQRATTEAIGVADLEKLYGRKDAT